MGSGSRKGVPVLFVTVSEGKSAAEAEPIVATSDPAVVRAVGRLLARKLGAEELPRPALIAGVPSDRNPGGL